MPLTRRRCLNNPDVFCYICDAYMTKKQRFNVCDFTKRANQAFFGMKLGNQNKSWAPHKVCKYCTEALCFVSRKSEGNDVRSAYGVERVMTIATHAC